MISLQNLSKSFGHKKAVDDVSLTTKEGEIIGFLGVNGAGKTTTMRLILGYLRPTSGGVAVFGQNPIRNRIQVLPKIGYLPENNPLYGDMKVSEYLSFVADIKRAGSWQEVAHEVGVESELSAKIEELSRGFKQRVGLAAALIGSPQLLILDEPTSGLDPIEQDKIRALIKKMAKSKTIIFSSHILSEVEDIATRLIIIHEGKIVYSAAKPKGKGAVEKLFKKLVK